MDQLLTFNPAETKPMLCVVYLNSILKMTTETEIYLKMKRKDFGESMCDETKLKVLNWILEQVYEKRCKCYRLFGSNKEYQTNLCPIHKEN